MSELAFTDHLGERRYISQYGTPTIGFVIHQAGIPADADANAVTAKMQTIDEVTTFFDRATTHSDTGTYETDLLSSETQTPGIYKVTWSYALDAVPQTFVALLEVGESSPAYDSLDAGMQEVVEGVWVRLADLFDSPEGGPHLCVDEKTQALTQEGWKYQEELVEGDLVLTLDHETGMSSWQPVKRVNRYEVVEEELVSIETKVHSSLTTKSHRWPILSRGKVSALPSFISTDLQCPECGAVKTRRGPIKSLNGLSLHRRVQHGVKESLRRPRMRSEVVRREWRTSETLKTTDQIITSAPSADVPEEAKWSDALVELVGWVWTEGNFSPEDILRIGQSNSVNPDNVVRIRRALTTLYGPAIKGMHHSAKWWESQRPNGMVIWTLNVHATREMARFFSSTKRKVVAWEWLRTLTQAQLELFIDVSIRGDGWYGSQISQADQGRMDAFDFACILAGKTPRQCSLTSGGWRTTLRKASTVHVRRNPRPVVYTGVVWCPTVSNGTWLARRSGTVWFTGNSVYFQSRFGRGRMAQLLKIALGRLNTIAQPHMTYSLVGPPEGARFPLAQWGGLLDQALYIESIKHLIRSYVEQPDAPGVNVARLDRRDYMDRWKIVLDMEKEDFKAQIEVFKMAHMGLGRPRVLVSGGAYGTWGPERLPGSAAARPHFWAMRY